jgi:hypothetical protein
MKKKKKIMTKTTVLILSVLFLLVVPEFAFAQYSETIRDEQAQSFDPDGVLSVDNKYGNITLRSWDKDSIRINSEIRINSKSRDRLALLVKRSRASIYLTSDFADVKTVVDESTLAKEWRKIKSIASSGGDQIEVSYVIYVPRTAKLEISNRFGNTYIHNHTGRIFINSEHGDVRLGTTPNLERAKVSFGKLFAKEVKRAELTLIFCDLDISKSKSLRINSKSSTIQLGQISRVVVQSTRDKIDIKEVSHVEVQGSLTKIEIGKLKSQMDLNLRYSKVWVQEIQGSFTSLRIKPKHSTVYLNFDKLDRVKTVIKGEDLSLDYDENMGKLSKVGAQYEGYIGTLPGKDKSLYISGEKTSFTIDFEKNK